MQQLFSGEYRHSLDAKSRLIVPARFRDILGSAFKIGPSFDPCLALYTNEGFDEFYGKLRSLPQNDPDVRKLVRYFMSGTYDVELDKQGRVLLPKELLAKANISKNVVFLGNGDKAELWDEAAYDRYMNGESAEDISSIASNLLAKGYAIPI